MADDPGHPSAAAVQRPPQSGPSGRRVSTDARHTRGVAVKGSVWIGVLARTLGQPDFRQQFVDTDRGEGQGAAGGIIAGLGYAVINSALPQSLWTKASALGMLMPATMVDMYVAYFGQRLAHLVPVAAGFVGVALAIGWTIGPAVTAPHRL